MNTPPAWLAYVGCRTTRERHAQGRGIAVFGVDAKGAWEQVQLLEGLRNPSWLCLHTTAPVLYTVHGDFSELSALAIGDDGTLTLLGESSTHGRNPVHLALTPSARWLLVANYATGNVVSLRVASDGALGAVAAQVRLPGDAHPHQVCFSPDGRFALVPDKGADKVFALQVNEDAGHLRIAGESPMAPGSGPRHMVFHPSLSLAYVVGELDRTVTVARYHAATGTLTPLASHCSVPEECSEGSAAGIVLSADARALHVSNRGHDSVASFPVAVDGSLGATAWTNAGRTPRFISLLPAGGALVVARDDGHSLAVLESGTEFKDVAQTGSPVCAVFRKAKP